MYKILFDDGETHTFELSKEYKAVVALRSHTYELRVKMNENCMSESLYFARSRKRAE